MSFLHELKEFVDLMKIAGQEVGAPLPMVEKDYWIMHCLRGLQDQGFGFFLKGGTSLSKGFGIIHRFSEDIDILITSPKEIEVKTGKNHTKQIHIDSRRAFFNHLVKNINISGISKVGYAPFTNEDKQVRSAGIVLSYETKISEKIDKLKEGILLEVGFDNVEPYTEKDITSWVYEYALKAGVEFEDNKACKIKCYNPEYTFVEKLQAISTKFRQQQKSGVMSRNFLRHYYDLYKLLELHRVRAFIGSQEYFEYKNQRFRHSDEKILTQNQALIMSDENIRNYYIQKYNEGLELYYRGAPTFLEILERLSEILKRG